MTFQELQPLLSFLATVAVGLGFFFSIRERIVIIETKIKYKEEFEEDTKKELKEIKDLITQMRLDNKNEKPGKTS